jgi:hypothetical protein
MAKQIAMGVYEQSDVLQNFGLVHNDWPATGTAWVRFWVSWDHLAPRQPAVAPELDEQPTRGGGTVREYVFALDAQIRLARSKGLGVILTFFNFPSWVNGVGDDYPDYRRLPPLDLSPTSWYAAYLAWVMLRWSAANPNNGGAYCNILEICNEPNLYQHREGIPLHFHAGRQMITARQIQLNGLFTPILAGPAVADLANNPPNPAPTERGCRPFVAALCNYLRSQGFAPDGFWMWTHHNYTDVKNGTTTLAQAVRDRLKANGFWTGFPTLNAANPFVYLTEGGSRIVDAGTLAAQASTMAQAHANCHNDNPALGEGLGMFTNYLDVGSTDPNHDTGLRDPSSLQPRPLYSTWASFPTT